VGCGVGGRGVEVGVEELHIVARNEAHPQTVEQSSEQKITSGSNKLTVVKETHRALSRACAPWAAEEISL